MLSERHDLENDDYFELTLCNCLIFLFSSLSYTNFTYGHNNLQKPFKQSIMVKYLFIKPVLVHQLHAGVTLKFI